MVMGHMGADENLRKKKFEKKIGDDGDEITQGTGATWNPGQTESSPGCQRPLTTAGATWKKAKEDKGNGSIR